MIRSRAFTLIELLVGVAVIAVLIGILLPALAASRGTARSVACMANTRQIALIARSYALDHRGVGPAVGQPYTALPNWALYVQQSAGAEGSTPTSWYRSASILVCPAAEARHARTLVRTYAMNGTGQSGMPGDRADYDSLERPAHLNFDRIRRPTETALIIDSDFGVTTGTAPPGTRTASVIDFRRQEHRSMRIGRYHPRGSFIAAMFDASARAAHAPAPHWEEPLP